MRGPYKYEILSKYPHLSEAEGAIWQRFVLMYPHMFKQCFYDVEVGEIRGKIDELKAEWQDNAKYLGSYKIDVLGETDDELCIVEVKKSATTKALGEVWLYEELYKKKFNPEKKLVSYIVTDEEMPNIREVAEKEGVKLFVV